MTTGIDTGMVIGFGAVVAVAAAVRSTWSPCGLSMLSTITPFGERSRGHRYSGTAAWFVAGSVLGGATLGAVAALVAAIGKSAGLLEHPAWIAGIVAAAAFGAAAIDAGAFGDVIPIWRRQVDDGWLVRYRRWVYASGFGWQIGVGVVTYIMTAAVFLMVVLAGLTANPAAALGLCAGFGLVRGLAVLATARSTTPDRLRHLHRAFDRAGPAVRVAVIVGQVAVGVAALALQWPLVGAGSGVVALVVGVAVAAGITIGTGGARVGRGSRPTGACPVGGDEAGHQPPATAPVATRSVATAGAGEH
jgi:hypothetical protein